MFRLYEIDMNNTKKQRVSVRQLVGQFGHLRFLDAAYLMAGGLLASTLYVSAVQAAGEVSQVRTTGQPGTPTKYSIDGRTFHWGMGSNQIMEGFSSDGQSYQYAGTADRVELVRHDVNGVSTESLWCVCRKARFSQWCAQSQLSERRVGYRQL